MKLLDTVKLRMVELAKDPDSPWQPLPGPYGLTVRRTWGNETPEYARTKRHGQVMALYDFPTYDSHVFLTAMHSGALMRVASCPWVQARDVDVPLWLVTLVLEDPELGLDTNRQLELKRARRLS